MIKHFFTNSFGILFSRILGFIRDLLTASALGASLWSDIFFVAFKLPNLFRRLFGEGAFTQAFLPGFVNARKKGVFVASVLIKFTLFITFLTLFVSFFAPFFTHLLALGFDENTINLAVPYVRINFWYLFFIFIVTLFASLLQYKDHFATTAFSTALLNLSMIFALILARQKDSETTVFYLSIGVVIGGFLQVLVHIFALKFIGIWRILIGGFKKLFKGENPQTKGFYKNFYYGVLGSSSAQIGAFIDTWFASFLAFGSISYLYYANRLFQLPLALFSIALTSAIFPKITREIKNKNEISAFNLLSRGFHILLFLLSFSAIVMVILDEQIVRILFEHGAFSAQNTRECALVLAMFAIGLLPFGLAKLFSLWLYAKMRQNIAAKIAIKSLILNLIACLALINHFGAAGLALASSISGIYLLYANLKEFGFNNFLAIIAPKKILLIALICAIETAILLLIKGFL